MQGTQVCFKYVTDMLRYESVSLGDQMGPVFMAGTFIPSSRFIVWLIRQERYLWGRKEKRG